MLNISGNSQYPFIASITNMTTVKEFIDNKSKYVDYTFNSKGPSDLTALGSAALQGNDELVKYILNADEGRRSVNQTNSILGWTPLFCATVYSEQQKTNAIAVALLRAGADPNIITLNAGKINHPAGMTPLRNATIQNNRQCMELLLYHGAKELESEPYSIQEKELIAEMRSNIERRLLLEGGSFTELPAELRSHIRSYLD